MKSMNDDNSVPVAVFEYKFNIWLFSVSIYIEDRRPDLTVDEAKISPGYKYKTFVNVKIFGKRISYTSRSLRAPNIFINDSEVYPLLYRD